MSSPKDKTVGIHNLLKTGRGLMRLGVLAIAICMTIVGLSIADDVHATIKKPTNIPAQPLAPALQSLAKDRNFQIIYVSEEIGDRRTDGAVGEYTSEEALKQLLSGTGLTYKYLDDKTITVQPINPAFHMNGPVSAAPLSSDGSSAARDQDAAKGSESKEGTGSQSLWDRFRVARADQGASAMDNSAAGEAKKYNKSSGSGAPDSGSSTQLEEITVTSERREEAVNKVPISITALSQQSMDDLHLENVADLAAVVPGLYVAPVPAGFQDQTTVAIRGIISGNNAPTTQFYIDETPVGTRQMTGAGLSGSPQPAMFDLDRVEVLRGPQGTLFGASAMGGAIRFVTPEPSLNNSGGFAKAELGHTQGGGTDYEVGVAYGAPVVAGAAGFRVSAWFQSSGGFIDQENPFSGEIIKSNANTADSYVIRPAFTWAPSEALSITPSAFLQHEHSQNPAAYWLTELPNNSGGRAWGGSSQPLTDDLRVGSLAIRYNFAGLTLQSDTSYLDRASSAVDDFTQSTIFLFTDGSPGFPSGTDFIPGDKSFNSSIYGNTFTHAWMQELRLSSHDPSSRVSWVAGAFYRHAVQGVEQGVGGDLSPVTQAAYGLSSLEFFNGIPNLVQNGQVLNAYQNFVATDVSEALFADVAVNITARLKADVGVRIEHTVVEHQNQVVAGPLDGVAYSNIGLPDEVANPVTPRVSLTYQYTGTNMIYASAASGYRPGGGNSATSLGNSLCDPSVHALGLSAVPSTFKSDSLWSYELGTKNSLLERKLSIAGSIYYTKWTGIQAQVVLPSCSETFTANRGHAISQGLDLQVDAVVAEGLTLHALAGYTNAYYPDAAYGASNNGVAPLLNGAGDKLAQIRPWTVAVNANYSRDISSLWGDSRSYLRLDYRWLSASNSLDPNVAGYDPDTGPQQDQGYNTLNVRLGVTHGGVDLSLYVNNATNADPLLGYFHILPGDPLYRAVAISPRTAGATAWYRF
jgi:outer membrane receptor protein involved in Fe transport